MRAIGYWLLAIGDWQWGMGYWILDMGNGRWVIGNGILAIGYWVWDMGNGRWAMGDFFANNFRFICVCQRFILILQKIV